MKYTTKIILWLALLSSLIGSSEVFGQAYRKEVDTQEMSCTTKNSSFMGGEHVEFKVYYNWGFVWLSAGKVVFDVEETDSTYRIVATGKSFPSYEWFFKVRDRYETILDKETLLPKYFKRTIHEGDYHVEETVVYDQNGNIVHSRFVNTKGETKVSSFKVSGCVQDVLSIIYNLRNTDVEDLMVNKTIPFRIFLEDGDYSLNVLYRNKEKRNLYSLGQFHTLRITPQLLAGNIFKEGDEMFVDVTDDDNHLPVYIESPVTVGSVKVYLTKYKNLRHPLSSRYSN